MPPNNTVASTTTTDTQQRAQRPIPERVAGALGQWWVDDHRQEQPAGEAGVRFSLERVAAKVAEGRLHPDVRAWATRKLKEAGNPAGAKARGEVLLKAIRAESGWAPDPTAAEFMPGAHLMISADGTTPPKFALGDCFPQGTLVVVRDDAMTSGQRLERIERLKIGDEIWGLTRWSKVEAVVDKGPLIVDRIRVKSRLAGNTDLHLTHDHHVYVLDCTVHPMLSEDGNAHVGARHEPCDCPSELRAEKRVRVVRLAPGMRLSIPSTNPVAGSAAYDRTVTMANVVDVEVDVDQVPCWDIQTDDHRVYLPEHDVTVSQCDDLTIAYLSGYLAAVESVGARAAVVGHSYSADRMIGHVLGAVFDKGRWWYADPSLPDMPFGECKRPTRERVYAVPSGEMFCDAALCLSGSMPRPPPEDTRGVFLSINGLEDSPVNPKLLGDFCDVDDPSTGANCGPKPSKEVWDARRSCEQRENIAPWHRGEEFEAPDGSDWEPRTQDEFSRAYTGPVGARARSQSDREIPVDMVITVPDVSTAETLDLNAISVGPHTAHCEPGEGPDGRVRPCYSEERPAQGSCGRDNFFSDAMPTLGAIVDDAYECALRNRR